MYKDTLSQEEIDKRINMFYKNYHNTLEKTILKKIRIF